VNATDLSTLDERVAAAELSPAERRVADFFVAHREEGAFLSAADLGRLLDTSDATVVRTAKSLGYAGLGELRRELIDALRARATPAVRLGRSLEAMGDDAARGFDRALAQEIQFIEDVRARNAPEDVARAVDLLLGGNRVACFGIGPSGALADYVALRLGRLGRQTVAVTATGLRLADELQQLRKGDVLLMLAHDELDPDAEEALRRANELGLGVLLVTDTLGPRLAGRIDLALSAPRSAAGAFGTSGATLALLDALLLAVAARERARSLAALAELNELRSRLRAAPLP
jgi:DNA-binding MurR/RpiR family transcriptional regulator